MNERKSSSLKIIQSIPVLLLSIFMLTGCGKPKPKDLLNSAENSLTSKYIECSGTESISMNMSYMGTTEMSIEALVDSRDISMLNDGDDSVAHIEGTIKTRTSEETKKAFSALGIKMEDTDSAMELYLDRNYIYTNRDGTWTKSEKDSGTMESLFLLMPPDGLTDCKDLFTVKETEDGFTLTAEIGSADSEKLIRKFDIFSDVQFNKATSNGGTKGVINFIFDKDKKLTAYSFSIEGIKAENSDGESVSIGDISIKAELDFNLVEQDGKLSIPDDAKHAPIYYSSLFSDIY